MTYSPEGPSDQRRVIIWDVRTGAEKRSFSLDGVNVWPIFRWSPDDKYFARLGQDVLSIYETPVSLGSNLVDVSTFYMMIKFI